MGCATSAPSVHASPTTTPPAPPLLTHNDENQDMEEEADKENKDTRNMLKINNFMETESKPERVLPLCDSVDQSLDIENKNCALPSTQDDIVIVDFENKEQDILNRFSEINNLRNNIAVKEMSAIDDLSQMDQDKNSREYKKLEEVVEEVVKMSDVLDVNESKISEVDHLNNTSATDVTPIVIEDFTELELEDMEEEIVSASSEGRATRWEALADIAAELPPSLTVDPLTGQIYTLSK